MQTHRVPFSVPALSKLLFGALLMVGACRTNESGPTSAEREFTARAKGAQFNNSFVATADVAAIDPSNRVITIRREDGSLLRVKASDSVRNFAQINAGDRLRVEFKETLGATLRPENESPKPAEAAFAAGRSELGSKPAGGLGLAVRVSVKVESIDVKREIVVYSLVHGELLARRIVTPEGREFVKGLKVGDTVQLDYTEALALSIEKL